MTELVLALSTVATREDAERIARALVERRLAACVNVLPGALSVYRWKGKVEAEGELLLVIKTRADRLEELKSVLPTLHPYEVPELIAFPIAGGHPPYLAWVAEASDPRPA